MERKSFSRSLAFEEDFIMLVIGGPAYGVVCVTASKPKRPALKFISCAPTAMEMDCIVKNVSSAELTRR